MGKSAFEAAMQQLADECNAKLPSPVCLLFEKLMYPLLMVVKSNESINLQVLLFHTNIM